jgi:NAD dependent epimerase/dehydratase family enzyme
MSWIDLADVVDIVRYVLHQDALQGPINAVAPNPVTNLEFTKTLGKVLRRPTVFPAPPFALRLALGEMADAMLLSSTRVVPRALTENGFRFRFPDLESSLRHLLAR